MSIGNFTWKKKNKEEEEEEEKIEDPLEVAKARLFCFCESSQLAALILCLQRKLEAAAARKAAKEAAKQKKAYGMTISVLVTRCAV